MAPCMQISERRIGHVTVLDLQGRLGLDEDGDVTLYEHIGALVREGRVNIVLNLYDVTHIDSCGIGAMVAKYLSVRRRGGDLKLLNLSERSHCVMAITHLLSIFEAFESEDEAIQSFPFRHQTAV